MGILPRSFVFYNPYKDKKNGISVIKRDKLATHLSYNLESFDQESSSAPTLESSGSSSIQFCKLEQICDTSNATGDVQNKHRSLDLEHSDEDQSISCSLEDSSDLTLDAAKLFSETQCSKVARIKCFSHQKEVEFVSDLTIAPYETEFDMETDESKNSLHSTPLEAMRLYESYLETPMLRANLKAEKHFQPLTWFSSGKGQLLYAFMHGFVASISPQLCHKDLTPSAIFIPQGQVNPFMMEVFLACGLAFMSNINPSYEAESRRKYSLCLSWFANELARVKEPQEWMIAAMLLFCLRDKVIGELPVQAAMHLSKAINHIDIIFKSQHFVAKNIKFMVESFLFNYSVLLLVGGKRVQSILPSPFLIFDKWRRLLYMQMFSCTVPWMNNPVFGAAVHAFEMAAKISWLVGKHPLSTDDLMTACDLLVELSEIDSYSEVNIPDHVVGAGRQHLQDSRLLSGLIVIACKIAIYKLINPSVDERNLKIQKLAQDGFDLLEQIPLGSPVNVIVGWPVLIIGLCLIESRQQISVSKRCIFVSEVNCVAFLRQVDLFLEKVWTNSEIREHGNLDHLFEELGSMCL